MKRIIVFELMRRLKDKPQLMRRLKTFAVVGVIGFIVASGFVIWAACLDQRPEICEGLECNQMKKLVKGAEGTTI